MFSDNVLELIFAQDEVHRVPLEYQTIMVHAVENALAQEKNNVDEFQPIDYSDI